MSDLTTGGPEEPREPNPPQVTQPNPVPPAPGRNLDVAPPGIQNLNGEPYEPPSAFRVIRDRDTPDAPPGISTLRSTTPQQRDLLSRFISESEDPAGEMAKQAVVDYLHVITGEPRAQLYSNYESEIRRYTGKDLEPVPAFEATKQWWDSAWLSYEANNLKQEFHDRLNRGMDVSALAEQITQLESRIADNATLSRNPFFNSFVQPAVQTLPLMLDPMLEGSTVGMGAAAGVYAASLLLTGGASSIVAPVLTYSLIGTASAASGTAVSSARIQTAEMTWELYQLEDESGNRIDPRLATTVSAVAGGINGLIEAVQITQLIPGGEQVFSGIVKRFSEKLFFNRVLRNRALSAMARYGTNVTDEGLEELQQEVVQSIATQLAIDVQNNVEGDFDRVTFEDAASRALMAFSEGWRASALLALPSNVIQTGAEAIAARQERGDGSGAAESIGADTVALEQEAAREEARSRVRPLVGQFEAPETLRDPTEVETEFDEAARTMRTLMEETSDDPNRQSAIDEAARTLFDRAVELEQIESANRLAQQEDDTPDIARMTRAEWQASQQEQALTAGEEPGAEVATAQTMEQAQAEVPQRELAPQDPAVVERIREGFPTITDPEQINGLAMILELRAEAVDMSPAEYLERSLSPESFTEYTPDPADPLSARRAGVFRVDPEDGRAIIQWTKLTQFSDAVHEIGHLFENQLSEENHNEIVQFFAEDGKTWDIDARERFAEAWETYILKGEAPSPELRNIFQRFADWMRQIYQRITASQIEITPEVRRIFDMMLTEDPTARIPDMQTREQTVAGIARTNEQIAADLELFQTQLEQTQTRQFRDWFGNSRAVDSEGRPLVVYHGTAGTIDAFDPALLGTSTRARSAREGFFFTSRPEVADDFARLAARRGTGERAENIVPVFLALNNPLEVDFGGEFLGMNRFVEQAKAEGRDGLIVRNAADAPKISPGTRDELLIDGDMPGPEMDWENSDVVAFIQMYHKREKPSNYETREAFREGIQQELDDTATWYEDELTTDEIRSDPREYKAYRVNAREWRKLAEAFRRDPGSVQLRDDRGVSDVYVAFEPEQIKSAIANRGTFDPQDPNILYSTRAYHGTPHDVTVFSLEKIGTGEGAQAFGWGLYFTSSESIARWYAKKLAANRQLSRTEILMQQPPEAREALMNYVSEMRIDEAERFERTLWRELEDDTSAAYATMAERVDMHRQEVQEHTQKLEDLEQQRARFFDMDPGQDRSDGLSITDNWIATFEQRRNEAERQYDRAIELREQTRNMVSPSVARNLYTVTLDPQEQQDRWLVYDKPISEQPRVMQAIENIGKRSPGFFPMLEPARRRQMLERISVAEQSAEAALDRWYEWMAAQDVANNRARVNTRENYDRTMARYDYDQLEQYGGVPEEGQAIRKDLSSAITNMLATRQENSGAAQFDTWTGSDLYDYLENAFLRVASSRPDQMASVTLMDEGIVGNDYPAGTLSGAEGEARNYVVFDDSIIQIDEKIAFSTARDAADERNLILHNLKPEDLQKIAELGGMPMPSLAVTRESVPHLGGFGAVTLVAPSETLDAIDVYDRDIYSPRVPPPEWKRDAKEWRKLADPLYAMRTRFPESSNSAPLPRGAYTSDMDQEVDSPSSAYKYLQENLAARLLYLDEHGIDYQIPTKQEAEADVTTSPALLTAVQQAGLRTPVQYAEITPEVWEAASEAWDRLARVIADFEDTPEARAAVYESYQDMRQRENVFEYKLRDLINTHARIAANNVITDIDQARADLIDNWTHEDFDEWLREKVRAPFKDPTIKIGRERKAYTLENVADAMRRQEQVASEQTMTFGPKKAAAMAARRLDTIEAIKAQNARISHEERIAGFSSLEEAQTEIMDLAVPYYKYDDVWDANNALFEAIGRYLKRSARRRAPGILRQELARQDFNRPNDTDTERILDYAHALADVTVNYLEARTQNALYLDDFVAAVVPNDIDPKAKAILAEAGIAIREYEAFNFEDRWRKVMDSAEQAGNVLFSTRKDANERLGLPDDHELAVQEAIDEGKWIPDEIVREYEGRDWADREIAERNDLRVDAARSLEAGETADEFVEMMMVMDQAERTGQYYREVYQSATQLPAKNPTEIANDWYDSLTKSALSAYLRQVKMNRAADQLPHGVAASITKSLGPATELTDVQYKKIMDQIRARKHEWFETLNALTENDEDLRLMEQAMQSHPEETELRRLQKQVDELRAKDRRLNTDAEQLRRQLELDRKYEGDLQGKIAALEEEIRTEREIAKEAVQSARAEARRAATVRKEEQHRELVEERRRVRQQIRDEISVRNYVKKTIKAIMQRPGPGIEYHYAQRILAIQEGLDTRSHRRGIRGKMVRYMRDSDIERLSDEALKLILEVELGKASLPDMNVEMLENVLKEIEALREAGRQAMKERVEAQKRQDLEDVEALVNDLGGSGFLMNLETERSKKELESDFLTKAKFNVYSNKRIVRRLGDRWVQLFDTEINRRTDEKLTYKYEKLARLNELKKRTGVTARQLMEMANEDLTVNQVVGIYIYSQNEDSFAAIRMGNQIDTRNMNAATEYMEAHPELKAFGDGLMELFDDESFERMQEVFIRNTNQAMERVQNYFPMRRVQLGNTPFDQELNDDLLSRTFAGKTYAWKGFTERRQHVRRMGQPAIRLDAMNIAVENIEKQEHYTALADHIKRLHRLLNNRSVQEAFIAKHGRDAFNTMREYVSRVANPSVHRAQTQAGKFFQSLRANMTVGALAFNLTSPLKNLVGPMLYLPYISDNPVEATARLTASMFTVLYDKQARDFIREKDPQVRERELDPALREAAMLSQMGGNRLRGFIQEWGMRPLQAVDSWTVLAGEWAVYSAEMAKHGDEARAIKAMQEATLLTQPFSQEKDTPAIYTDNTAKMFLMFSSPLNQIFGMVTQDLPEMMGDGRAMSAGLMMISLILTGVVLRSIGRKRLPDEPEEWAMDIASQFLEMIPFIGPEIMMAVERNPFAGQGVSVTEPFVEGVRAIQRVTDSETEAMDKWNAAVRAASEGMRLVGLPGVQANRLYRIFVNETGTVDPWYLVGGRPEPPSEEE